MCKVLLSFIFLCFLTLACEGPQGPVGPEGPQGAEGAEGEHGRQGEDGPGARVINFSLEKYIKNARMEAVSTYASPQPDTGSFKWGAVVDTTIHSVSVADTEFVLVYAELPEVGFKQLPINVTYRFGSLAGWNRELDQYNFVLQQFYIPEFFNIPVSAFEAPSRHVYSALLGSNGYFSFTTTGNNSQVNVHTLISSGGPLSFDSSAVYAQQIKTDEGVTFPLDDDLSNATEDSYNSTDSNGELVYNVSTDQVAALKDSLGTDLDLALDTWKIFNTSDLSGYTATIRKNPTDRNIQLAAQWSSDSIRVTGYLEGFNYGNDQTAYINNFPVEIRIVIVSGNILQGKKFRIPYEQIESIL